jgi:hypothetical protein
MSKLFKLSVNEYMISPETGNSPISTINFSPSAGIFQCHQKQAMLKPTAMLYD